MSEGGWIALWGMLLVAAYGVFGVVYISNTFNVGYRLGLRHGWHLRNADASLEETITVLDRKLR